MRHDVFPVQYGSLRGILPGSGLNLYSNVNGGAFAFNVAKNINVQKGAQNVYLLPDNQQAYGNARPLTGKK
ncbi:hypothetical protein SY86_05510 [Erwinia tracheiphila]|uniref:Uncharacterized protein n=1 Tax=Erwinia tracheiphila TaxID=65700 RepID=A0A0M2K6I8_9GAMM|nr:hypothetical protein SY86_05510 [Erwinia tracheiphila]